MIRNALVTGVKVVLLTIIGAIVTLVVSSVTAASAAQATSPDQATGAIFGILIVSFVDSLVLLAIIKLSRWAGLALMVGLAFSFFGVKTFMGQIEALAFLTPLGSELGSGSVPMIAMPPQLIIGLLLSGIILAIIIVPLAVRLFGKARGEAGETRPRLLPSMGAGQWLVKLLVVIVLYELLYFGFGYYVAWQSPAVLEFYQGTDPGSFLAQIQNVARNTPLLISFQGLRGLLWVIFAMPVIMMLRHRPWVGALTTGILLAITMNIQNFIPNAFMPYQVRMVHFVETASSNFILGMFLFWIFHRGHRSLGDLVGVVEQAKRVNMVESI